MKESGNREKMQLEVFFHQGGFLTDWVAADGRLGKNLKQEIEEQAQKEWFERFERDKYGTLYEMGFLDRQEWMTSSAAFLFRLSRHFMVILSSRPDIEVMRGEAELLWDEEEVDKLAEGVPFASGAEFVDKAWILMIWEKLLDCFKKELGSYDGTVAEYFMERNSHMGVAGRIYFHLVESKEDAYPFAFMATYSTRPAKSKRAVHTPLKHALLEFKKDREKLLSLMSSVAKAAEGSPLISDLMESGELFSALRFTEKDAYTFLKEIPVYEKAGIMCRVPDWWKRQTNSLRLSVSVGKKEPSGVGVDALLDFSPALMIDGEELTQKELKEFLSMAEGLVNYKGKWVEINKKRLNAALSAFEKAQHLAREGQISVAEAMRMEMMLEKETGEEGALLECTVTNGQWLKELRTKLLHPKAEQTEFALPGFNAVLRPYQSDGFKWLEMMGQIGLGACLADDMGLGKRYR